ncbi:RNase H domain-containing protein [Trichonephila clavipes]|nr:RNase H domain-containing protein [Trichonephila clavipes]
MTYICNGSPSQVDLYFNDLADELAKEGSNDPIDSSDLLTYNEIYSKVKTDNNRIWKTPPSHDWYQQNGPGAALELKGGRKLQAVITRLISCHSRGLTFVQGQKTFLVCLKCNVPQQWRTQDFFKGGKGPGSKVHHSCIKLRLILSIFGNKTQ